MPFSLKATPTKSPVQVDIISIARVGRREVARVNVVAGRLPSNKFIDISKYLKESTMVYPMSWRPGGSSGRSRLVTPETSPPPRHGIHMKF